MEIKLNDLQKTPRDENRRHALGGNNFVHRLVPSLHEDRIEDDAGQLVCIPLRTQSPNSSGESSRIGTIASIKFGLSNKATLPTLHHIVERLAELPVFEIVQTNVTSGAGFFEYEKAFQVT